MTTTPKVRPRIIVNLSPYDISREMQERGVFDLPTVKRKKLLELIEPRDGTMDREELVDRARRIARMADGTGAGKACVHVPIELVSALERELRDRRITPVYPDGRARRYKADTPLDDVSEVKVGYRLEGFTEPPAPEDHG